MNIRLVAALSFLTVSAVSQEAVLVGDFNATKDAFVFARKREDRWELVRQPFSSKPNESLVVKALPSTPVSVVVTDDCIYWITLKGEFGICDHNLTERARGTVKIKGVPSQGTKAGANDVAIMITSAPGTGEFHHEVVLIDCLSKQDPPKSSVSVPFNGRLISAVGRVFVVPEGKGNPFELHWP